MALHTTSNGKRPKWRLQDTDLERVMGNMLRAGVLLSAAIVLLGAILYLKQYGYSTRQYSHFGGEPRRLTDIGAIWNAAWQGHGRSIIQLGLLVLIATPVVRIVISILGYVLERDWKYVVITLIVLAIVLGGL